MSEFLVLLSLLPLIGLNIWHGILLAQGNKDNRPHSISHHAVDTPQLLRTHRIMHTLGSVILIIFSVGYLIPRGYTVAACLLIAAAVFDVIEVFTLNKENAAEALNLNSHTVTAWSMAFCYLLYVTAIISVAKMNPLLTVAVWFTPAILAAVFRLRKFNGFWIAQHVYFCLLALLILIAHVRLLAT